MDEETKELIYFPTEIEKAAINNICSQVIDLMSPLNIEQKAFALQTLVSSFEETANIKLTAIKYKDID